MAHNDLIEDFAPEGNPLPGDDPDTTSPIGDPVPTDPSDPDGIPTD